jgi:SAM-dependent methyltransferase
VALLPVPAKLQRGRVALTHEEWLQAGLFAVDLIRATLKREDLSEVDLLDVGCGTKLAETLLNNSIAIGSYVGIDVYSDLIDWLQANVSDPRFEFHRLDAHNERYNPDGDDLGSFEQLPVGERSFDMICLFSVFTHLAPHDYVSMLRLLRRHARSEARLLFSLFLTDEQGNEQFAQALEEQLESPDPEVRQRAKAAIGRFLVHRRAEKKPGFSDEVPDQPLMVARYEPEYALELMAGTGWELIELHPPQHPFIQHYMICAPV